MPAIGSVAPGVGQRSGSLERRRRRIVLRCQMIRKSHLAKVVLVATAALAVTACGGSRSGAPGPVYLQIMGPANQAAHGFNKTASTYTDTTTASDVARDAAPLAEAIRTAQTTSSAPTSIGGIASGVRDHLPTPSRTSRSCSKPSVDSTATLFLSGQRGRASRQRIGRGSSCRTALGQSRRDHGPARPPLAARQILRVLTL